jgi:general secretion pathway protein A
MFREFYGLKEQPFGVTPDPRFLYLSPAHREALSSLFCGIDAGRGFLALIAKPGMGKTTLLFQLLAKLRPSARTAFLFQTQCTSREFMRFLLMELGLMSRGEDLVTMHEEFNRCLLEEAQAGRRFIIVIDEAQNLEPSVLETVRLLSDFETPQAKLLQIILSGQPELADKLARPSLRQLRQRVSLLSTLGPLPPEEVERYIDHRLRTAGYEGDSMFTLEARKMIAQASEGIPRSINNLCFNSLSLGCALRQHTIGPDIIREATADLDLAELGSESESSDFESEMLAAHSFASVAGAVGAISKTLPSNRKDNETMTPEEALALIQDILRRLKDWQGYIKQTAS